MFDDLMLHKNKPVYLQIKDYIKQIILNGILQKDVRLPSTRELATLLDVSRNTIILAYQYLEDEGFVNIVKGKGAFVCDLRIKTGESWNVDWMEKINEYGKSAEELDIIKHEAKWKKGMISFTSIAPDDSLFNLDDFKRAFLDRFSLEGGKILNYGYAKGYKPLMDYLMKYMENKGVDPHNKEILITNGFTEGFDLALSVLTSRGDRIICENPTHNTAIKIMKLHGLDIVGIPMEEDGMDLEALKSRLSKGDIRMAFTIPSYHNPTGVVMSAEKREEILRIMQEYQVPLIEDGFNEELRYSGSHMAPLAALCGRGNGILYIGSLSKVLFPGLRIGWIMGDAGLIDVLESAKRSRNIHTSFLDQAILYEYLQAGSFEKYLKRARRVYREKWEWAVQCAKKYIPCKKIMGQGGLHIFIQLDGIPSREVLKECMNRGVIFTPGDIFYTDSGGQDALRLGFSRLTPDQMEKGFRIIGEVINELEGHK